MPWAQNADLPNSVTSALPKAAQTVFRNVANSALDDGKSEAAAMQAGWGAVKQSWKKPDDGGKWVKKVGARHTRAEYKRLQEIHDNAVWLGAECGEYGKADRKTLYVRRDVYNAADIIAWAKTQGIQKMLEPGDLHVTITYSKVPMVWPKPENDRLTIATDKETRKLEKLGEGNVLALIFDSGTLNNRHNEMREYGASFDFDEFKPHISITYQGEELNADELEPYTGQIVLGPEIFEEVEEDFSDQIEEQAIKVSKVDEELGIVYGWAIICKVNGEDYYDSQGDHIPEDAMIKASAEFMLNSRTAGDMHRAMNDPENDEEFVSGDYVKKAGDVVFSFPMTTGIAKDFGIETPYTGLLIGMRVEDKEILGKFKSGEYTGFSIGGRRLSDEEVKDG